MPLRLGMKVQRLRENMLYTSTRSELGKSAVEEAKSLTSLWNALIQFFSDFLTLYSAEYGVVLVYVCSNDRKESSSLISACPILKVLSMKVRSSQ